MDDLAELQRLPPVERYRAAGERLEEYRRAMGACAQLRADALRELQASGTNMSELARLLGVSRNNLYRIMQEQEQAS